MLDEELQSLLFVATALNMLMPLLETVFSYETSFSSLIIKVPAQTKIKSNKFAELAVILINVVRQVSDKLYCHLILTAHWIFFLWLMIHLSG